MAQAQVLLHRFVPIIKKFGTIYAPDTLKALGPIGFSVHFKASKWLPDVAQSQLTTTTFFSSCVKLDY